MKKTQRTAAASTHRVADDLRGLGQLAVHGVAATTDLVEAMHAAVTHLPSLLGKTAPPTTTGLARAVYRAIRGVTTLAGAGVDASLTRLAPLLGESGRSPRREAALAIVNGVVGDHLHATGNPLAIDTCFRHDGRRLTLTRRALAARLPQATGRVLVLVHGLCMNDLQWRRAGHDHGQALQRDIGCTPVHLHYNTGLHISGNGQALSALLDRLVRAWPVPVLDITLLCHSMGGLVARSAIDTGFSRALPWSALPLRVVFLGTPHHGAPLERAGSWVDTLIGISPYSAPLARLGRMRSAGIQDLRHGNLRESDWRHPDRSGLADRRTPMPLPAQVRAYAIAASTQGPRADGGLQSLRGDGLVPIASALGRHPTRAFDLRIPASRRSVAYRTGHLDLLGSPTVYRTLLRWLRVPAQAAAPSAKDR